VIPRRCECLKFRWAWQLRCIGNRQPNRRSQRGRALVVFATETRYGGSPGNSEPGGVPCT
jgi:hypothetical protein